MGADGMVRFVPCDRGEPDARRSSVSEAVRFAKSNNLLGVMVDAILLNHVPQLVHAIKAAGLVLITIGKYAPQQDQLQTKSAATAAAGATAPALPAGEQNATPGADTDAPDGSVEDGIVIAR